MIHRVSAESQIDQTVQHDSDSGSARDERLAVCTSLLNTQDLTSGRRSKHSRNYGARWMVVDDVSETHCELDGFPIKKTLVL